ncbi:hypothetical protein ARMA_1542 [Ardenticatena maritima]|uniref:Uncharacterized protein n=1 Tax=Ardenticatena maritima TaxID=872965 RepID=A0A0M8K9B8_9CHLR|nr:hypothetical protein ARMA_1542 [Ardenticatena maritima]
MFVCAYFSSCIFQFSAFLSKGSPSHCIGFSKAHKIAFFSHPNMRLFHHRGD